MKTYYIVCFNGEGAYRIPAAAAAGPTVLKRDIAVIAIINLLLFFYNYVHRL